MVCGEIVPNVVTMIVLLLACALKGVLNLGRKMHHYIEEFSVKCTLKLMNAMLHMYVKWGCLASGRVLLDSKGEWLCEAWQIRNG